MSTPRRSGNRRMEPLASWIVDKFHAWGDCDGDVERSFTKDELLTNATGMGRPLLQRPTLDRDAARRTFRRLGRARAARRRHPALLSSLASGRNTPRGRSSTKSTRT
jgi:hypothetical protein